MESGGAAVMREAVPCIYAPTHVRLLLQGLMLLVAPNLCNVDFPMEPVVVSSAKGNLHPGFELPLSNRRHALSLRIAIPL